MGIIGRLMGVNMVFTSWKRVLTGWNMDLSGVNRVLTGVNKVLTGVNGVITGVNKVLTGVNRSSVGAVSYTHRRAHETAYDLLCRLILEEKNNYTLSVKMTILP